MSVAFHDRIEQGRGLITQSVCEELTRIQHSDHIDAYYDSITAAPFSFCWEDGSGFTGVVWVNPHDGHFSLVASLYKGSEEARDLCERFDLLANNYGCSYDFLRDCQSPERAFLFEGHFQSFEDIGTRLCDLAAGKAAEMESIWASS